MATVTVGTSTYFIDPKLIHLWTKNSIKVMKKTNNDRVYLVDGRERIGKTQWTLQQAGELDLDMFKDVETFLSRICFTPEEFFNAVRTVKNGVIIFDEAFRGFSSRAALSKVNRKLIQALMEMGQNNNIVFIVLPSFFLLDIYPAMLRSDGLFNIYLDKESGKRCWRGYNKRDKNKIYQNGIKRGWSYNIPTGFKGNFYDKFPGGEEYLKAYLEKKHKALIEMDKEPTKAEEESRFKEQRNLLLYYIYSHMPEPSLKLLQEEIKQVGVSLDDSNLSKILGKIRKNGLTVQIST